MFFQEQEISREREFVASQIGNYKKIFLIMQTHLGGQSYYPPPFNPLNPVSSRRGSPTENGFDRAICLARQQSHRLLHGQHCQHLKRRQEHHAKIKQHQQPWEEEDKEGNAKDRKETTRTRISRL
jgi:hypothetical protein